MKALEFAKKHKPQFFRDRLNETQYEKLKQFIVEFLPKTGEKRKYTNNQLQSLHQTIDATFLKYCGYGVHDSDIIKAFDELDYSFFTKVKSEATEYKVPKVEGFYQHLYDEWRTIYLNSRVVGTHLFYVDASSDDCKKLSLTHNRVPIENGNEEKTIQPRIALKKRLQFFFHGNEELSLEDFIPKKYLNDM